MDCIIHGVAKTRTRLVEFHFTSRPPEFSGLGFCLFFKHLFTYLAVPGLSWGIWTLSCSVRDLVPWPGIEPGPLHWEHGVLPTGPPEKSRGLCLNPHASSLLILALTAFQVELHVPSPFTSPTFCPNETPFSTLSRLCCHKSLLLQLHSAVFFFVKIFYILSLFWVAFHRIYHSYLCHFWVSGFILGISTLELFTSNMAINIFHLKLFPQNKLPRILLCQMVWSFSQLLFCIQVTLKKYPFVLPLALFRVGFFEFLPTLGFIIICFVVVIHLTIMKRHCELVSILSEADLSIKKCQDWNVEQNNNLT